MSSSEIVVTIGPSSDSVSTLRSLKEAGATSFRINLSHSTIESVDLLLKNFADAEIPASIDTQGAQLRTSSCSVVQSYSIGQQILFSFLGLPHDSDDNLSFLLNHSEALPQLAVGDLVRVDFEGLIFKILSIDAAIITASVLQPGTIKPNKAVDIIGKCISLNPFTSFDLSVFESFSGHDIKSIYVSFANKADDIKLLRSILAEHSYSPDIEIIAKIETVEALSNLSDILPIVDGVLVDRGDLSREISISKIPYAVNTVIDLASKMNTKSYVATNVLDTMINSSLPSRAEISDLHSLLHKGISGIVLAAEVAIGNNPVNCVHVVMHMRDVCAYEELGLSNLIPRSFKSESLPPELQEWL